MDNVRKHCNWPPASNSNTIADPESQQGMVLLWKFYGCDHDLVNRYGMSVSQMARDVFRLS